MKQDRNSLRQRRQGGKGFALFFLALVCLLLICPQVAWAKTEEYEIKLAEGRENYVFSIQWENSDQTIDVVITSPSGQTYTQDNMPQAQAGEGELMFWFAFAEAGSWKVSISGEGLGQVSLDSGVMPGKMDITSFSLQVSGEEGTASWSIQDCEENLTLEIWAAPDPVHYGGERLTSVGGKASDQCHFSLGGLDSGEYYLYLKAIGREGVFAVQYADHPVSWRRGDALPKLEGVAARMMDDDLWISWDKQEDVDTYRILVYDFATEELLTDEIVTEESQWFGEIPQSTDSLKAAVAAYRWGHTGDFELYPVTRGDFDGVSVTFPEGDQVNQTSLYVEVSFTGNYKVSGALNGEMLVQDADQAGRYRVDMEEGDNRISFYVADEVGNIKSFGKDLHVDVTPPQLSILEDLNGLSTSEEVVYLEGHTEAGARLTLNGEKVETQNGYFSIPCSLSGGENQLELLARDAAGNETRYRALVDHPRQLTRFLPWLLPLGIALVLLILYLRIFMGRRRKG